MKIRLEFRRDYGEVYVDGEKLDPALSLRVFNHSPTGFAWGYGGSGPAQLALALLMQAGVDDDTAVRLHQRFKSEFVATWSNRPGVLEFELDPAEWARETLANEPTEHTHI